MVMSRPVFLVLFASLALANAWWCTGHMLVAHIGRSTLCPKTYRHLESLLVAENKYAPKSPDFTQCACWADDIKPTNALYDHLHYSNYPLVNREPLLTGLPPAPVEDIVWAITTLNRTLSPGKRDYALPTDIARALFFMIHFVGDLHQPLHATTMFSGRFPKGDMGGNLFKIEYMDYGNLHSFWDSGASQWKDFERPLSSAGYAALNSTARDLMNEYPISTFTEELKEFSAKKWAEESFGYARDFVYSAAEAPAPLADAYVKQAMKLCRRQVALGGYRLAQVLQSVFGCQT